jgi:hypothetical protein
VRRVLFALCLIAVAGTGCAVGVREPATDITDTSATLNGKVLSTTGGPGSWYIEYGPTQARTEKTPTRTIDFEANKIEPVSEPVSGLEPGTTYHFAVCAEDSENLGDAFCSPDQTFVSLAAEGDSATGVGSSRDFTFDFAASSGPSGENPEGTFSGEYLDFHLEGPVICLKVEGNVATLVFTHDAPNFGHWAVVTVVDNELTQDTIAAVTYSIPKDCSARETTLEQSLTDGDIVVTDAPASATNR